MQSYSLALRIGLAFVLASPPAFAQLQVTNCSEGRPRSGDVGITSFECVGGDCTVSERDSLGGYFHDFLVEPIIRGIRPGSVAATALREGDVVIMVDGFPITTHEAGRRLASLSPGKPVTLRIRRGQSYLDVKLTPEPGCNTPSLSVRRRS
jgi:S1-C subfamily serine protease